ncbi:MAG: methyl-accepting chemotaxis protein [Oleiphilaceae bacterium]
MISNLFLLSALEQQSEASNEISKNIEAILSQANQNTHIAVETVNIADYLSKKAKSSTSIEHKLL